MRFINVKQQHKFTTGWRGNVPVFGVTQAHLLFPSKYSGGGIVVPSGTIFSSLTPIFSGFETNRLGLLKKLELPILPVDARLQNDSTEASEQHEALSDKLDRRSSSCLLNAEAALRAGDDESAREVEDCFSSNSSGSTFSAFLEDFKPVFRAATTNLALFPAGPSTGFASGSSTFMDRTLGAPDMETSPCPTNQTGMGLSPTSRAKNPLFSSKK